MSIKLKILIVEDDAIIAQLIEHHLLDFGHHVLDIVHNSEKALDKIANLEPDLVLLDVNILGERDGIEIAEIMQEKYDIPYIFLTALSDPSTLDRAQKLEPIGYIVKPFKESDLLAAITIGMSNYQKKNSDNSIHTISLEELNKVSTGSLSEKEYEIIMLAAKGYSNNQIAKELFLSINTIKWHTQKIYSKMDVKSRTELVLQVLNLSK